MVTCQLSVLARLLSFLFRHEYKFFAGINCLANSEIKIILIFHLARM